MPRRNIGICVCSVVTFLSAGLVFKCRALGAEMRTELYVVYSYTARPGSKQEQAHKTRSMGV